MEGLGLDIPNVSVLNNLPEGIPVNYITESGDQYVAEDNATNYTTEG